MGDLKKLGKYTIQSVLGQGAMGIVYQGFDPVIERTVAIKAIRKDAFKKEAMKAALARFKREAQAAGRLTHPGIVTVYDYGEDGDTAFIAMEYVPGRELDDFLEKKERFPLETVIDIISQLLDALIYSHSQGVVHRDIKPENIIVLADGRIKVMDFGIAKIESSTLTQFGDVFGTPSYMSPEQFSGQPVDNRSDLYSAGIILYHLLTGEKPFHGDSITSIMHRVMTTEASRPSDINVQVPSYLDEVLRKALAKKPSQRFQTAEEFKAALTNASMTADSALEDLYGKTNTELREMCTAAGITGTSRMNKKQLIAALQDLETSGSAVPETNPPSEEMSGTEQQNDQAAGGQTEQLKKYDKTLFEPLGDEGEEVKPKRSGKKLKKVIAILVMTIFALTGFTAWKVYKRELTSREIQQIIRKAEDDPAALFGQFITVVTEKSKDIAESVFEQITTIVKEKSKDIAASVLEQETAAGEEKPKAIPASVLDQGTAVVEEKPSNVPTPVLDQEAPVVEEKAKTISAAVIDQDTPVVKEKPKAILASSTPVQEITLAGKKSKNTPPSVPVQESPVIEITQTSKHKVKK